MQIIYVDFKNKRRVEKPVYLTDSEIEAIHARIDEIEAVMAVADSADYPMDNDLYCSLEDELTGLLRALQDVADANETQIPQGVSK